MIPQDRQDLPPHAADLEKTGLETTEQGAPDQEPDESEQSSLEEPPEEEPSTDPDTGSAVEDPTGEQPTADQPTAEQERPGFDAADNSPARQAGAQGEPGVAGERSAPTRPVTFPAAGGFGMVGFGG